MTEKDYSSVYWKNMLQYNPELKNIWNHFLSWRICYIHFSDKIILKSYHIRINSTSSCLLDYKCIIGGKI